MKIIIYYLLLLVFIALFAGFLASAPSGSMSMPKMVSLSIALGAYVVLLSFVGEGRAEDERQAAHRYFGSRIALIAGTTVLSLGILWQMFHHELDYWLLAGLIAMNLTKIVSLIYATFRK